MQCDDADLELWRSPPRAGRPSGQPAGRPALRFLATREECAGDFPIEEVGTALLRGGIALRTEWHPLWSASILGYGWIDLIAPGKDASGEVYDFGIALLLEQFGDALAAAAALALHNDFALARNLA